MRCDSVLLHRHPGRHHEASGRRFSPAWGVLPYDRDCSFATDSFANYRFPNVRSYDCLPLKVHSTERGKHGQAKEKVAAAHTDDGRDTTLLRAGGIRYIASAAYARITSPNSVQNSRF